MKVAQVPIRDIYTMEYYLAVKEKKIFPFAAAWMDLENILLSEISQSEKDKHHMISLTCGIQWTNWSNQQTRDRLTAREQDESYGGVGGLGTEGMSKKEKGLLDMGNSVRIAQGSEYQWVKW